jgi:hypothetical protein
MRMLGPAIGGALAIVAACGGGDTGGSGSNSTVSPSACMTPCTPGSPPCVLAAEGDCNGDWYCWSDSTWHCAPPDASSPGEGGFDAAEIEASLMGEGTGDGGDEGGISDGAPEGAAGEAGAARDAGSD